MARSSPWICGQIWRDLGLKIEFGLGCFHAHQLDAICNNHAEVEVRFAQFEPAGLDLGEVEDVVDEFQQMMAGGVDDLRIFYMLADIGAECAGEDHLGKAEHGVQRRAQLVAHVGEELRFRTAGRFGPEKRVVRCSLGFGQSLDQIVLVVAKKEHVARGFEYLARHKGEIADIEQCQKRQAVIFRAAFAQRQRNQRESINGVADEGQNAAGADQRGVAGKRAADDQHDKHLIQRVAVPPEQEALRRPHQRESRIGDRRAREPIGGAIVVRVLSQ